MASFWTRRVMGVAIVFAAFLTCIPAFAQTGGLTGKCTGQGGAPLAGYTIQIERIEIKWTSHVKTNKKGEYTYIGLAPGEYKITLLGPDGKPMYYVEKQVGIGDPTEVNFDMAQAMEEAKKEQEANPEYQKQVAEQKQSASLKQMFDQGRALYAQKQYTDAAAIFEKALPLAKDKNIPIVLGQLADTWAKAATTAATSWLAQFTTGRRDQWIFRLVTGPASLDPVLDGCTRVLRGDPHAHTPPIRPIANRRERHEPVPGRRSRRSRARARTIGAASSERQSPRP